MLQDPARTPIVALFTLLLGLTVALVAVEVIEYAYARIGIDSRWMFTLLALSLLGGNVNLPLARIGRGTSRPDEGAPPAAGGEVDGDATAPGAAPDAGGTVLAVNLGGAIIPAALSAYLLVTHAPLGAALAAVVIVAVAVHRLARPVPGVGIAVPLVAPPLLAAAVALLLAPDAAPAVAYVGGVLGTLIGADLTNLRRLGQLGGPVASIGGAGTFDGIFVTGILAVLLA